MPDAPETSAAAALEWLRYKGFQRDGQGHPTAYKGEYKELRDYNGTTKVYNNHPEVKHQDWYAKEILDLAKEMEYNGHDR